MRATLVRHAEVDERYKNCYNGHNNIGLSENGEIQVKELAKELDAMEFDAVFCSDFEARKRDTATLFVCKRCHLYTEAQREVMGNIEGLSFDEIIAQGEIEYIDFLQWIEALDGESYKEYIKRVEEFFLFFLPSLNKESVLVVTHAGVIRVLMSIIKDITLEEAFGISVKNGSFVVFDFKDKNFIEE